MYMQRIKIIGCLMSIMLVSLMGVDGSFAEWRDITPANLTQSLYSVWGTSPTNIYAVGLNGTILHYNGSTWNAENSGTTNRLNAVWGTSETNIYAAGENIILHKTGSGTNWSPDSLLDYKEDGWDWSDSKFYSIKGTDANHVYAGSENGYMITYDGIGWTSFAQEVGDIKGICPFTSSSIYVLGTGYCGRISKYDGLNWSFLYESCEDGEGVSYSLWGTSATNIYAAGTEGLILHFDGTNWTNITSSATKNFYCVHGSSAKSIVAVGASGAIFPNWGSGFVDESFTTPKDLFGVWVSPDSSTAFAVGTDGIILQYVPCIYTLSESAKNLTSSAAFTGSLTVTAGQNCTWTAASDSAAWLSITAGANGTGSGMVSYTVAENTSLTQRTGKITVTGQGGFTGTLTVTQPGASTSTTSQSCTYMLSDTSKTFTSNAAGTGNLTVTAGQGCTWTATVDSAASSWLSISSGSSGTGTSSVNYAVTENTAATQRAGTITVAGQGGFTGTLTVTQPGTAPGVTTTTVPSGITTTTVPPGVTTTTTQNGVCPPDYPIDCASQGIPDMCCSKDYPVCGSDGYCYKQGTATTTTTSVCLFAQSLNNPQQVEAIRKLRDSLVTNTYGSQLIALYYQHAEELQGIIENNPQLKQRFIGLVAQNYAVARQMIWARQTKIEAEKMQNVINFLKALKPYGSQKFQSGVDRVVQGLEDVTLLQELGVVVE
jgi:hypothetical protein